MSTLIYSVREDSPEKTGRTKRDRSQVSLVIILAAVAVGPGVFFVDRVIGTVAWRAFLAEALSLCLYAALAVWYGLHSHPTAAWRVASIVYLIGLSIMGLVGILTKRGLSTLLVDSPRANEPILWAGVLMLFFVPLLGGVVRRYPTEMKRLGLGPVHPRSRAVFFILAGLGTGLLIGFHLWLTAKTAGVDFAVKPWPYIAWQICYEIGPQSLSEELFMRGVVFNELFFGRGWGFWTAALAASGLELLSLVVKQDYSAGLLIIAGVIFYTVVSSVASAALFRWSRNILSGYVNNVVFGIISLFR